MQIKLLPLVAAALLLLNGCSLIGFAIGSQRQVSKTYQSDELAKVRSGQTIIVSLNDGTAIRGKYAGYTFTAEGAVLLSLQQASTGEQVFIAQDDVLHIRRPGKRNAALVGFLIGLGADMVVSLMVSSTLDFSPSIDFE